MVRKPIVVRSALDIRELDIGLVLDSKEKGGVQDRDVDPFGIHVGETWRRLMTARSQHGVGEPRGGAVGSRFPQYPRPSPVLTDPIGPLLRSMRDELRDHPLGVLEHMAIRVNKLQAIFHCPDSFLVLANELSSRTWPELTGAPTGRISVAHCSDPGRTSSPSARRSSHTTGWCPGRRRS